LFDEWTAWRGSSTRSVTTEGTRSWKKIPGKSYVKGGGTQPRPKKRKRGTFT